MGANKEIYIRAVSYCEGVGVVSALEDPIII